MEVMDTHEPKLCAACGKDMVDPVSGGAFVGMHLAINIHSSFYPPHFYREQLGVYAPLLVPATEGDEPGDIGSSVSASICWECWFKSLGVKVPTE